MPSYTLYAPAGSFRAFPALIAAEYNGMNVTVKTDLSDISNLSPSGKAPVLVVNDKDIVFSSASIARFLGGMRRDTCLQGSSLVEQGQVDAWMDFCAHEIELPACVWYYPVSTVL
jgi:elongation factor 1-gamma